MISHLRIQNILSHKDTQLDLSPGVNAIIGISESGKSTVLRALRLLGFNRPLGMDYQSYWGGEMRVVATLSDGTEIVRGHNKKQNYYTLKKPDDNEPEEFKSFKGDVPEPIQKVLPLSPDCFHRQHDSPFLIGTEYSAADVARHFNRVAGIDDIDVSQKNLRTWSSRLNTELRHVDKDIQAYEAEREKLGYLPTLEQEIIYLDEILRELGQCVRTKTNLRELYQESQNLSTEEEEVKDLEPLEEECQKLEQLTIKIKTTRKERLPLVELERNLQKVNDQTNKIKKDLSQKEKTLQEQMPEICPFCEQPIKR